MKNINKIMIVVSDFPSLSQTFISLQIAELCKSGFDIQIVNLGKKGNNNYAPDSLKKYLNKLAVINVFNKESLSLAYKIRTVFKIMAINMVEHPLPFLNLFFTSLFSLDIRTFIRVNKDAFVLGKDNDFDLIHCQFATIADRLVKVEKYGFIKYSCNLVCSVRGVDISRKSNIKNLDWPLIFKRFSLFLPVCNYFIPVLKGLGCEKDIKVIHSPVNFAGLDKVKKYNNSGNCINILSVGRFVEKKGFDDALEAVFLLSKKYNNFYYRIIGNGPLFKSIGSKIKEYGLEEKVELTGEKSSEEVLRIMAASDILLAPSKTAEDGDSEGIPNVLKEAMFLGLYTVSTYHSGIPELIQNGVNGFLVEEKSPEKIFEVLEKLIIKKSDNTILNNAAVYIKEKYSPETVNKELLNAYKLLDN